MVNRVTHEPVGRALVCWRQEILRRIATLFRRDQSDLDGSFRLRNLIPGSYTVVAIENGWDLDWAQPGVSTHYAKHGQTVTVGNQAGSAVHLRDVVEVQSR